MPAVSRLSYTSVKGLALVHPDELYVDVHGVDDNRRFFLIREDGRRGSGAVAADLAVFRLGTTRASVATPITAKARETTKRVP